MPFRRPHPRKDRSTTCVPSLAGWPPAALSAVGHLHLCSAAKRARQGRIYFLLRELLTACALSAAMAGFHRRRAGPNQAQFASHLAYLSQTMLTMPIAQHECEAFGRSPGQKAVRSCHFLRQPLRSTPNTAPLSQPAFLGPNKTPVEGTGSARLFRSSSSPHPAAHNFRTKQPIAHTAFITHATPNFVSRIGWADVQSRSETPHAVPERSRARLFGPLPTPPGPHVLDTPRTFNAQHSPLLKQIATCATPPPGSSPRHAIQPNSRNSQNNSQLHHVPPATTQVHRFGAPAKWDVLDPRTRRDSPADRSIR